MKELTDDEIKEINFLSDLLMLMVKCKQDQERLLQEYREKMIPQVGNEKARFK